MTHGHPASPSACETRDPAPALSGRLSPAEVVSRIFTTFLQRGHRQYGESVTELQHALQCATFAGDAGERAEVIASCLLHDFGHLLHELGEDIADHGVDSRHELLGANHLARWFPPEVVEPIRMHADSKRYLCRREEGYFGALSPASQRSLELQGGPMSTEEAREFEAHPHFELALRVRRYDDRGKVPGMPTPDLATFRLLLESLVHAQTAVPAPSPSLPGA
ncbi:MAG: HD domain-containing protein [Verrucomicrobiales bacterium]|nr:HD domain-containing protein [Verrucomicrobiales bacterium]